MTTIESPALPEWEATLNSKGWLPGLREDEWARDPDYLIARLREALGKAADAVAEDRATGDREDKRIADAIEVRLLRDYLERLASDLRSHTRAADEMLELLTQSHPQIRWHRNIGGFCGLSNFAYDGDRTVADCALQLRLPEIEPRSEFWSHQWEGPIEGWTITVTDHA